MYLCSGRSHRFLMINLRFPDRIIASICSAWEGSSEGSFRAVAAYAFCHL